MRRRTDHVNVNHMLGARCKVRRPLLREEAGEGWPGYSATCAENGRALHPGASIDQLGRYSHALAFGDSFIEVEKNRRDVEPGSDFDARGVGRQSHCGETLQQLFCQFGLSL